jgi:hypothetical protein
MVPLLGINITKSVNMTIGPIMGDLAANLNTSGAHLSPNQESMMIPLILSWNNLSPLPTGIFWLKANLTDLSGKQNGSYGSTSGVLNLVQGQNKQIFYLMVPIGDFSQKNIASGSYSLLISISKTETSEPIVKISRTVIV